MKRWILLAFFLVVCITLLGYAFGSTLATDETPELPALTPTPTPSLTPTPLPGIQATIRARVQATIDNLPTPTSTLTPTATATPTATHTPSPTATPSPLPYPLPPQPIAGWIEEVRSGVVQYTLSHPLQWQDGAVPGLEYWAFDPDSSRQISVRVERLVGTTDIDEYGSNLNMLDATIDSRGIVFPGRTRPSYRIDYTTTDRTTGSSLRGSMLITLLGSDAISVTVVGDAEEWEATKAMADEIFLRFRVNR